MESLFKQSARIFAALGIVLVTITGCSTTSKRVVFKQGGVVVTHFKTTNHAIKLSGHGGYILIRNSAVVFENEYPVIAGEGSCVIYLKDRNIILFVSAIPPSEPWSYPDRELHIVDLNDQSDTAIFLGTSNMGDNFGSHEQGSKYEAQVQFDSDQILRITTFDGITASDPIYEPRNKTIYVIDLANKQLVSEVESSID